MAKQSLYFAVALLFLGIVCGGESQPLDVSFGLDDVAKTFTSGFSGDTANKIGSLASTNVLPVFSAAGLGKLADPGMLSFRNSNEDSIGEAIGSFTGNLRTAAANVTGTSGNKLGASIPNLISAPSVMRGVFLEGLQNDSSGDQTGKDKLVKARASVTDLASNVFKPTLGKHVSDNSVFPSYLSPEILNIFMLSKLMAPFSGVSNLSNMNPSVRNSKLSVVPKINPLFSTDTTNAADVIPASGKAEEKRETSLSADAKDKDSLSTSKKEVEESADKTKPLSGVGVTRHIGLVGSAALPLKETTTNQISATKAASLADKASLNSEFYEMAKSALGNIFPSEIDTRKSLLDPSSLANNISIAANLHPRASGSPIADGNATLSEFSSALREQLSSAFDLSKADSLTKEALSNMKLGFNDANAKGDFDDKSEAAKDAFETIKSATLSKAEGAASGIADHKYSINEMGTATEIFDKAKSDLAVAMPIKENLSDVASVVNKDLLANAAIPKIQGPLSNLTSGNSSFSLSNGVNNPIIPSTFGVGNGDSGAATIHNFLELAKSSSMPLTELFNVEFLNQVFTK